MNSAATEATVETFEAKVDGGMCGCSCHGGACAGGKCGEMGATGAVGAMSVGMMAEHGCCAHNCMRRVWRAMLVCVGVLAVFWIGMAVGEFRVVWHLDNDSTGPSMMYGGGVGTFDGSQQYPNMMYRRGYVQQAVPAAATVTVSGSATTSEATSTPARSTESAKKAVAK